MAKTQVLNLKGEKVKDLTLKDAVWNIEVNEPVMHDAIVLAQASLRQGTASTKTRSEVSGGGRKPYKQKGTGNARQGSTRSPQWPGGGIVFGPKPRKYDKKQNRKERRLALKSALSAKFQDKELIVVENYNLDSNKTKAFNEVLGNLKVNGKAVVVYSDDNENLFLASRNNNKVAVLATDEINVLDIVAANYLVIDESSVKKIEEVLN
ncbi:MAG: 50S ribosomal protein L4 [Clostridium sp.]|jgi:large subunit ribosomal protein L4|nr:50S ribosomal protein L4 [Clostridium sp.]